MYSVDELAAMFGLTRRTIRYYVARRVLPPPKGGRGANARYDDEHVRLLRVVRADVHDRVTLADLAERRLTGGGLGA